MVNDEKALTHASKFLSFVLRHDPGAIGLQLDSEGWASLDDLVRLATAKGETLDCALVLEVVRTNSKKRFQVIDGRIRAVQGHSTNQVDRSFELKAPPPILYHGTASRFLQSILSEGLRPNGRQHVHLSADIETARVVGQRHGKPVVLVVESHKMAMGGTEFFLAENGVWLVTAVPAHHLTVLDGPEMPAPCLEDPSR